MTECPVCCQPIILPDHFISFNDENHIGEKLKVIGKFIASSHNISETSYISAIRLSQKQVSCLRYEFYLKNICCSNPKATIINIFKNLVDQMIESKHFTLYTPTDDNPIFVLQTHKLPGKIQQSIVIIGLSDRNDIVIDHMHQKYKTSIRSISVFLKNKQDSVVAMIVDAWCDENYTNVIDFFGTKEVSKSSKR